MSLKNLSVKNKVPNIFLKFLKKKNIHKIYRRFEKSMDKKSNFAVAVSGGPDSMALVYFSKIFAVKNGLNSKYFIVNHNLRKDSAKEAKLVKKILKKFSINAQILDWKGKKPKSNLQSLARKKRYDLLFKECKRYNITNILIGHHLDDLLENFFIRILRGSGLKGLISLGKKTTINNVNLLRPLLDIKKGELEFVSKNVFNFYIKDPSNQNNKFQRIKIRNLIKVLQEDGLDKKKFLLTINNLKHSDDVIKFYKNSNIQQNTHFSSEKNKLIINETFFHQPSEIVFRSFSDLVKLVGNKYYDVRGKKINKIIRDIKSNNLNKATLGGCIIEKVSQSLILSKEVK